MDDKKLISYDELLNDEAQKEYDDIVDRAIKHFIRLGVPASFYDDFYQECWMKILEYAAKNGFYPEEGMAMKISKNRIADVIDYEQRRNNIPISTEDEDDDRSSLNSYEDDPTDIITYNDLIDMFPKGSQERKYLQLIRDKYPDLSKDDDSPNIIDYRDSSSRIYDKDPYEVEHNIAKTLGYPDASASSYRNFREKMRKIVRTYYGKQSSR